MILERRGLYFSIGQCSSICQHPPHLPRLMVRQVSDIAFKVATEFVIFIFFCFAVGENCPDGRDRKLLLFAGPDFGGGVCAGGGGHSTEFTSTIAQ